MEVDSCRYLRSELMTSGSHCQNYHNNYDYPPRYRQRQRFHRDISSYQSSVPTRDVSNIYTSSLLSTSFGVQSCAVMHGRTQRVNRRHPHGKQHNGLSRYRVNHVMFGDRRGVARCDLRREWNVNGHGNMRHEFILKIQAFNVYLSNMFRLKLFSPMYRYDACDISVYHTIAG